MALVTTGIGVSSGSGTAATGTLPTGIVAGQQLVAFVRAASISAEPSGWTQVATVGSGPVLRIYRRKATGSDTAPGWTVGAGDWIVVIGRDPDADPDAAARSPAGTRGTTWAQGASVTLTPGQAGDVVYYLAGTASAYASTPPSGMAERADRTQGASALTVCDETLAATGEITRANTFAGWQNVQGLMVAVPALAGGGGPPAAPTGLGATPVSATRVDLSWVDVATNEAGYTVERSLAGAGSWSVLSSGLAAGATSYSDTAAAANTAYDYRVKATNASGSSSYATATSARTYPGAPTSPGATATSSSAITVSWTAPSGGATSYKVERSPNGTSGWAQIASGLTGTSYGDAGLTAGTAYHYRVRATNATGDGAYSGVASATTSGGGGSPPAAPAAPAAAALSASGIRVSWTASAGATGYTVERSPNGASGWSAVVAGHAGSPFDDAGLSPATAYHYRVIATNAAGSSAPSAVVSATTLAAGTGATYAASAAWRWIQVEWPLYQRHKQTTASATAAGGTTSLYYAVSADGVTWRYYAGPLSSGLVLAEVASQAAAESAAISLAALAGSRFDLPQLVEARFFRVYFRNTTHATTWREYYPRRLVQADDMEAESVRAIHISAGAVTADKILVGALDGFTITGATIRTNDTDTRVELSGDNIRVWNAGVRRVEIDTDGLKTFDSEGNLQIEATTATDGALTWAAGKGRMDRLGMRIALANDGSVDQTNYRYVDASGNTIAGMYGSDGLGFVSTGLYADSPASNRSASVSISASGGASSRSTITLAADQEAAPIGGLPNSVAIRMRRDNATLASSHIALNAQQGKVYLTAAGGVTIGDDPTTTSGTTGGGLNMGAATGAPAGAITLAEIATPSSPAANSATLFSRDAGGVTRSGVLFANGAACEFDDRGRIVLGAATASDNTAATAGALQAYLLVRVNGTDYRMPLYATS